MKKNFLAVVMCFVLSIQLVTILCACESMSNEKSAQVLSAEVSGSGQLLITLDNGVILEAGEVTGENGLAGKDGKDGKDGLSAYELYVQAFGYRGTEEEWILDLVNGELKDRSYTFGLSYRLLADNTLEVSLGTADNVERIVVPARFEGYPVTRIAENGFAGDTALKEIVLPDSVKEIGKGAFRCCVNLETVTMGAGVSWDETAFDYCSKVELPVQS
ncbi:MAG: leucine-rich repeat protein [Christensenellaceae bacterium]